MVPSTSLLSSTIHICLCGGLHLVQTASGAERPSLSLPSIFTNASQVLGTAGLTLISLKYLFHPSSEQIEQKHWRLFEASANALETSLRQKSSTRICSLGLQFVDFLFFFPLTEGKMVKYAPLVRGESKQPFSSFRRSSLLLIN